MLIHGEKEMHTESRVPDCGLSLLRSVLGRSGSKQQIGRIQVNYNQIIIILFFHQIRQNLSQNYQDNYS
jgi:hypothetical protein